MNKILLTLLILSVVFVAVAFLGANPSSLRGFYYVVWLSFCAYVWKQRDTLGNILKKSPLGGFLTFLGLGLLMIFIEETLAGIAVNILHVESISALFATTTQFYANNFLLLPGFIVGWYILLKRYAYTQKEVFVLVGLFGVLLSEKIHIHIFAIPILGIPLILPTMFTYMGIIAPSILSMKEFGKREISVPIRYGIGLLFPWLVSIPFVVIHILLSRARITDPTVLTG